MKCIILAAGRGTRMGKLTKNTPKPMLKINNKPKLAWSIENLPKEIKEVILITGYLKEQISDFFKDSYSDKKITYLVQKELNGTAGSIELVKDLISEDEKILILMGDDFYKKSDLEKLIKHDYSVLSLKVANAEEFAILDKDSNNNLLTILEKPHSKKTGLINIGAYVVKKDYFKIDKVKISDTEYGLPQTLVKMSQDLNIRVKVLEANDWFPVGNPKALNEIQNKLDIFIN